ncbi:hypothetical protein BC832DRAFT_562729 [Gaertneriomyces semiglobifer]|nr:hypothetical protein BC832DRAFT_562729 [Gaertneriomyces semiglobifer]
MRDHMYVRKFSFDQPLHMYEVDRFLLDFLNDPEVHPCIQVLSRGDKWTRLGVVSHVEKEELRATVRSLDFFDRLNDRNANILRPSGEIIKMLETCHDSFMVADHLRACLLMPEFESYDIFSEPDRKELIFHIFKALCLGGRLCQYEDEITPYIDATKAVYKDMISPVKDPTIPAAFVFSISAVESSASPLFPMEHPQNFCILSVDPRKRTVTVMYHASDAYY